MFERIISLNAAGSMLVEGVNQDIWEQGGFNRDRILLIPTSLGSAQGSLPRNVAKYCSELSLQLGNNCSGYFEKHLSGFRLRGDRELPDDIDCSLTVNARASKNPITSGTISLVKQNRPWLSFPLNIDGKVVLHFRGSELGEGFRILGPVQNKSIRPSESLIGGRDFFWKNRTRQKENGE